MGGSVTGDTKILTQKRGLIPISEVDEYEKVLSMTSDYKTEWSKATKIEHPFRKTISMFYQGCPTPIRMTEDHSVFILGKDYSIMSVEAKNLKVGDYLISFNSYHEGSNHNPELAYILGLFLAEGSFIYEKRIWKGKEWICKHGVSFSFHTKEKEFHKAILSFCAKFDWGQKPQFRTKGNGITISFKKKSAYEYFFSHCGRESTTGKRGERKRFPEWIWTSDYETRRSLWQGWFDGDGTKQRGKEAITTANERLSQDLAWLEKSLNLPLYIGRDFHTDRHYTSRREFIVKSQKDMLIPAEPFIQWRRELQKKWLSMDYRTREVLNISRGRKDEYHRSHKKSL